LSIGDLLDNSNDFSSILKEAISKGMTQILGESGARATAFHLEMSDSDYDDPAKFHRKLLALFSAGAYALEKIVAEDLYSRLGLTPSPREANDFVTLVLNARRAYKARAATRRGR
jgi:hypothetical protein